MSDAVSRFMLLRRPARSMTGDISVIVEEVRPAGFSFVPAEQFRALLTPSALAEWPSFAASWDDLGVDTYMADGGRYRRRRFATFAVSADGVVRKAHQPHYQSRDYNPLNGGIERWFGPVTEAVAAHPVTLGLLDVGRQVFDALTPAPDRPQAWHVELHQFRIEARAGQTGQPTPEGLPVQRAARKRAGDMLDAQTSAGYLTIPLYPIIRPVIQDANAGAEGVFAPFITALAASSIFSSYQASLSLSRAGIDVRHRNKNWRNENRLIRCDFAPGWRKRLCGHQRDRWLCDRAALRKQRALHPYREDSHRPAEYRRDPGV